VEQSECSYHSNSLNCKVGVALTELLQAQSLNFSVKILMEMEKTAFDFSPWKNCIDTVHDGNLEINHYTIRI